jgi:hypothetical protein
MNINTQMIARTEHEALVRSVAPVREDALWERAAQRKYRRTPIMLVRATLLTIIHMITK